MRARISQLFSLVVFLILACGVTSLARACPSCQQALAEDASHGDFAKGIYYSILFMMSMPFAIVGTFAGLMYRAVKREQRRVAEQNGSPPANTQSQQ